MAENCKHEWVVRPGGLKQDCVHCKAARKVGAGPCNDGLDHDYQPGKSGKKEYCSRCGAARSTLKVADSVIGHSSDVVGG